MQRKQYTTEQVKFFLELLEMYIWKHAPKVRE